MTPLSPPSQGGLGEVLIRVERVKKCRRADPPCVRRVFRTLNICAFALETTDRQCGAARPAAPR